MNREVKERTILDTFAEDFAEIIEKYAKYVIVSEFVAIAHGRSRGTEDVDIIIERIEKDAFKEELLRSEKDIDDAEHLRIQTNLMKMRSPG